MTGGHERDIDDKPFDEPSAATARNGEVLVDGPDGVAISFTPIAAAETSDRLLAAATVAAGQRAEVDRREREDRDRRAG